MVEIKKKKAGGKFCIYADFLTGLYDSLDARHYQLLTP